MNRELRAKIVFLLSLFLSSCFKEQTDFSANLQLQRYIRNQTLEAAAAEPGRCGSPFPGGEGGGEGREMSPQDTEAGTRSGHSLRGARKSQGSNFIPSHLVPSLRVLKA